MFHFLFFFFFFSHSFGDTISLPSHPFNIMYVYLYFPHFTPNFPLKRCFSCFYLELLLLLCTFCLKQYCQISKSRYRGFLRKYFTNRFILIKPIICMILREKKIHYERGFYFLFSYFEVGTFHGNLRYI